MYYRFLSYLTFYPPKKNSIAFYKSWKNFFEIGRTGYQKKGILHQFHKCAEVSSLAKGKKKITEKLNF